MGGPPSIALVLVPHNKRNSFLTLWANAQRSESANRNPTNLRMISIDSALNYLAVYCQNVKTFHGTGRKEVGHRPFQSEPLYPNGKNHRPARNHGRRNHTPLVERERHRTTAGGTAENQEWAQDPLSETKSTAGGGCATKVSQTQQEVKPKPVGQRSVCHHRTRPNQHSPNREANDGCS